MVTMKKVTVERASPLLQWAGRYRISVIPPVPCPAATLPLQPKDLDPELEVLLVCTVHSRCLWPTVIAQLAAPTFTTLSALQQTGNSHQFPPCLPTTRASRMCQTEARQARLTVATAGPVQHHNIFTTRWRGPICMAPSTPVHAL